MFWQAVRGQASTVRDLPMTTANTVRAEARGMALLARRLQIVDVGNHQNWG
jgi:hypothetical protein